MLTGNSTKLLSQSKAPLAKCINLELVRNSFFNRYRHGPTKRCDPRIDYLQVVKDFFSRKGIDFFKEELRRTFLVKPFATSIPKDFELSKTNIFEHFNKEESFSKWKTGADSDTLNGYSTAKLTRSVDGHALFHGFLDNRIPDDGATQRSGCVALIGPKRPRDSLFKFDNHWNWSHYNCIEIRFRGDGRRYSLVCSVAEDWDDQSFFDTYSTHLFTRGGPYWETRRIPFSKLVYSSTGFIQDQQHVFPDKCVKFVSITLEDSVDGPFSLEIDYVGLRFEPDPVMEENAYEHYTFPHIEFKRLQVSCAPPDQDAE